MNYKRAILFGLLYVGISFLTNYLLITFGVYKFLDPYEHIGIKLLLISMALIIHLLCAYGYFRGDGVSISGWDGFAYGWITYIIVQVVNFFYMLVITHSLDGFVETYSQLFMSILWVILLVGSTILGYYMKEKNLSQEIV